LSVSSGSSRGSLGSLSTGSKGSLNSQSITDIYRSSSVQDVNLLELHRRVEHLLNGHQVTQPPTPSGSKESLTRSHSMKSLSPGSSLSSLSPPVSPYEAAPPPSYAQHIQKNWPPPGKSVSPIQEIEGEMAQMHLDEGKRVSTRPSVSAAVSDESVAGDSGVFEAAYKRYLWPLCNISLWVACSLQIKWRCFNLHWMCTNPSETEVSWNIMQMLKWCHVVSLGSSRYEGVEGRLLIGIEQARNLNYLAFPGPQCQVYVFLFPWL
jgi:protein KIBRA